MKEIKTNYFYLRLKIKNPEKMEAIQYSQLVTALIQELNDLYNQAQGLCRGLESSLTGFHKVRVPGYTREQYDQYGEQLKRITTFPEQMEIIKLYLQRLGGMDSNFTQREWEIAEDADIEYGSYWKGMVEYMQPMVEWLRNVLIKCQEILRTQHQQRFQQVGEQMSYIPPNQRSGFPGGQEFWNQTREFYNQ